MTAPSLRDAQESDFEAILALNAAAVQHTSELRFDRLQELARLACYHKVAVSDGRVAGFLLAMREGAPYQNDNFAWFAARYERFIYVDRIVIDAAWAGMGVGSRLYDDLFEWARRTCTGVITCEYNIEPPNLASKRFHDRFGFREVGTRWVTPGTKRVSLQASETRCRCRRVSPDAAAAT